MVELNNTLHLVRMGVFATTSLFALIVIILGALVTNFSDKFLDGFFNYAALGIAAGLLTLFSLPVMLALSIVRKGAFTSMVAFEIGWIWFLWILWVSVGGNSASSLAFVGGCSIYSPFGTGVVAACNESTAITAFGFLNWVMLLFYNSFLATLTFRQHLRGNTGIWTKDVTDTDFMAVGPNNPQIVFDNKVSPMYATQYPPAGTIVPQQTSGSFTPAGSPYQSPQAPGLYNQPPAAGSFTQHQAGSPYPQV
jgi:hypothetical protein